MNLVVALLVIGGSSALVWSGITDPEGGTFAGLGRLLRGETQPDNPGVSFTATLAALSTASGSGQGSRAGGDGAPSTVAPTSSTPGASPSTPKATPTKPVRTPYNLGPVKPHVAKAAREVGPMFGITSVGGYGLRSNATDHDDGLALDFMVSDARGTALANYVLANRRRLAVTYVIWRQRINSGDGRGWRPMENRGSATANHMDHVHVSFAPVRTT